MANGDGVDYSICFEKKILPQIEEIMSNYGDICLAWFDVPMTISSEQSQKHPPIHTRSHRDKHASS